MSGRAAMAANDPATDPAGLAHFRELLRTGESAAPICHALDFHLSSADYGTTEFTARLEPWFTNPGGVIHGGFLTVVLSSAMSCAVHTTLKDGERYTTTDIVTHLVRPLLPGEGPIVVSGRLIRRSRSGATAEGRVVDSTGRLVAHGTTTCVIFPTPLTKVESEA